MAYGEVVRKVGRLLRGLEEQSGFVSREEDGMGVWDDGCGFGEGVPGGSKVHALCEMVLEDLNNYAECMIPIGTSIYFKPQSSTDRISQTTLTLLTSSCFPHAHHHHPSMPIKFQSSLYLSPLYPVPYLLTSH